MFKTLLSTEIKTGVVGTPLSPAFRDRGRQISEFQASQGYILRLNLKNKKSLREELWSHCLVNFSGAQLPCRIEYVLFSSKLSLSNEGYTYAPKTKWDLERWFIR